jgi:DNA modification methylase
MDAVIVWRIAQGDACERMAEMSAESVQTCVTSPPYWGLRDYGHDGQIGLESTPAEYVTRLVEVFAEVHRVLRDDGTLWLNLGDSYAANRSYQVPSTKGGPKHSDSQSAGGKGSVVPLGMKPKDLVGIPWMVAFALRDYGWYLRSEIIWHKPNPMPESVTDRPTKSHEQIFLFSKSARYYYDAEAIKEASEYPDDDRKSRSSLSDKRTPTSMVAGLRPGSATYATRNKRSVWTVPTQPYPEAHFATYPEALIEPCILAGSKPGDLVLDPFTGSGTTGAVAIRHQRSFVGTELNPAYIELARRRIGDVAPLLASEVA